MTDSRFRTKACSTLGSLMLAHLRPPVFRSLFAVVLIVCSGAVLAHDHNRADLSKWFEKLHDRKGDMCCDGSEAMHLSGIDWDVNGSHYRVRVPTTPGGFERAMAGANVETEWVYVPDEAVIDEPNRANVTLVWPLYGPMGVSVRCFVPGTMM
ncbi:hypothetical protein NLM33_03310 [Bradyrhizobium sp. CCGUVB1N3]|uniref:hypothetical protein n=1 Tax=Bradyrhizobium sp. CCGUVB1N3 TaxID=2949629 RepID=UPI0020B257F9|nr:hypothetical protein [Bradyrhizobium sp. CCGUVB1N3]MCP3469352.1 hypothetical protein [Bradyrhizobium sp. CCGUVB1N3]